MLCKWIHYSGREKSLIAVVIFSWCLCISVQNQAQDMYVQPVEHIRPKVDTGSIRKMIRAAMQVFPENHDSALALAARAEYYSRQAKFKDGILFAINVRAYFLRMTGLFDSSIVLLKQAIPYTYDPERIGYAHNIYNDLALAASSLGQYDQALQWYTQALKAMHVKRFTANHSSTDSCTVMVNMAIMWIRLGEHEQSVKLLKEAEKIAIRQKTRYGAAPIYLCLGEVFLRNQNYDSGAYYFRKSLHISGYYDENNFGFCALGGLANVYLGLGRTAHALELLCDSMTPGRFNQVDAYLYLDWQHSLGLAYLQKKEYGKAFSFLAASLDSAVDLEYDELIQQIAPDAATAASTLGRHKAAYDFMRIYALVRDTMFERGKVRFLHAWGDARVAEKDKTVFPQKLYISQQRGEIQARNFMIAAIASGILLLLIFGLGWYRSYRHRQSIQQAEMRQLQQQQEIGRLKARVQGEEQERNRIAVALHNGVASQLWGARMNIEILQRQGKLDEDQQTQLQEIYKQLEEATVDIRNTAHNMMPALLLDEGLGASLASLCAKTRRNTGLEAEYQEYGNIPRLDPEIEHLMYRMVQELVQNTMKHALSATHLLIQLSCSGTVLNITVEDNGPGFTLPLKEGGIGLQHICRNVQTLCGNIDIKTGEGNGAAVYMEFDIQHLL